MILRISRRSRSERDCVSSRTARRSRIAISAPSAASRIGSSSSPSSLSSVGHLVAKLALADDADRLLAQLAAVGDQRGVQRRRRAVLQPVPGRRRPSIRSRAIRMTSAVSDGLRWRLDRRAPARLAGGWTAYGSTPCPSRSNATAPGASDGPRVDAHADRARASPLRLDLDGLGGRHASRARAATPAPAPASTPPVAANIPDAISACAQRPPRGRPRRADPRPAAGARGSRSRSSPAPAAARRRRSAAAPPALAGRRRPARRRAPAASISRAPTPGASQHLGEHQQVVSVAVEVGDRAREAEPDLLVEAPRAALPLQARGLDPDDVTAALPAARPRPRRSSAPPMPRPRAASATTSQ